MSHHPQFITVPTRSGSVRGRILSNGVEEYLGIPYGTAARFQPPSPYSWNGMLDCLKLREKAPQPNYLGEKPEGQELEIIGDEDCLNLNIWVQPGAIGHHIPVVIYVHGGGFQVGSNQDPAFHGGNFIQSSPIVFVSVNYRLGVLGFLQLGDEMGETYINSGNCGALDVLHAVRWVNKNIEAFGGDPNNVTLMGISAGAKMIGSLLNHPDLKQMCHSVVLASGCMQSFRTPETAREVALRYEDVLLQHLLDAGSVILNNGEELTCTLENLCISFADPENEREQQDVFSYDNKSEKRKIRLKESILLNLPMYVLLRAQADFCDHPGSTCWFGPVLDGKIFPENWRSEWQAGRGWHGKAILGSCQHEMAGLVNRPDFLERKDEILENLFGDNAHVAQEHFDELEKINSRGLANWERVLSDFMYRYYTDHLARHLSMNGSPVWVYSYQYGEAMHGSGFHTMFHDLQAPGEEVSEEEMLRRRRVSREMRSMVRRFICTGTPEEPTRWPEFHRNSGYVKMVFDAVPHTESRPKDTIDRLPDMVYKLEPTEEPTHESPQ